MSDPVDKNRMADAEIEAELQGLEAGKERRGSNASQVVDCFLETMLEQMFALGADQARSEFEVMCQMFFTISETLLRRCQERKKEEDTVKMNKSKAEPVSSWCYQRQAGSMKVLRRVVWSLIFPVFGVCRAKAEEQGSQAQKMGEKDLRPELMSDGRGCSLGGTCEWKWDERVLGTEEKEKRNSQGKRPKDFCRKQPGWRPQNPLKETARESTWVPSKETARRGSREPQMAEAEKWKGGEFRKSERKRRRRRSTEEGEEERRTSQSETKLDWGIIGYVSTLLRNDR